MLPLICRCLFLWCILSQNRYMHSCLALSKFVYSSFVISLLYRQVVTEMLCTLCPFAACKGCLLPSLSFCKLAGGNSSNGLVLSNLKSVVENTSSEYPVRVPLGTLYHVILLVLVNVYGDYVSIYTGVYIWTLVMLY